MTNQSPSPFWSVPIADLLQLDVDVAGADQRPATAGERAASRQPAREQAQDRRFCAASWVSSRSPIILILIFAAGVSASWGDATDPHHPGDCPGHGLLGFWQERGANHDGGAVAGHRPDQGRRPARRQGGGGPVETIVPGTSWCSTPVTWCG